MTFLATWPAPNHIKAMTTSIHDGHSQGPYASYNLGLHVDDNIADVLANRHAFMNTYHLKTEPAWLNQTHSTQCVVVEETSLRDADASITRQLNQPLVILTADCLPILLCNQAGTEIAAIHAGWRGLLNGIVHQTIRQMTSEPHTLMAWIGPAICARCFEIGPEIEPQFTTRYPFTAPYFKDRYGNLPGMAEAILRHEGLHAVHQSHVCTFEEKNACYSYRRTPQTGRMGSFIWIQG